METGFASKSKSFLDRVRTRSGGDLVGDQHTVFPMIRDSYILTSQLPLPVVTRSSMENYFLRQANRLIIVLSQAITVNT
jgi:hypothetical protein